MREIEHRHLRYAIAAADLGSFRQTATKFNIRQSAISRRIRDLENQLGATLFDRTTSGVVPTAVGRAFLERARASLEQLNEAADIVAESGRGVLRIGFDASCGASFVTALLGRFVSRHRRTDPVLVEAAVQDLLAGIRARRLDVALLTGRPEVPDCNVIQLWLDRVVAVLPESNSLARKETIHWRDLMDMSFLGGKCDIGTVIHECLTRESSDIGYDPQVEHFPVGRDMLIGMVSLGKGFSLTMQSMPECRCAGVVYRPIFAPGAELPFNAVTSDLNDTQTLRSFLRMAFLARTSMGHLNRAF
ncbi:LysR family transcriptional regulator [Mesorhizobium sp. CO1-1-8]|uniref:LysR substrate-binding domain-containing protein n=1 Tax=Mesorhizobium sp. CO1-1-8 TaxID=2876631 RepID=UPI001CD05365|nr:LysR family transcriptional regulator [Mesorhizobium sp. CO1-1-8]MBZ9775990.1 LysR family transcriptional regulator [Mesorhizobium sp. CO1-1-8]